MIPARRPDQSFDAHQREMAAWLGAASVDEMNGRHDPLHRSLCAWLGIESMAMRQARGEPLSLEEATLAAIEEVAVLSVQKLICYAGIDAPG